MRMADTDREFASFVESRGVNLQQLDPIAAVALVTEWYGIQRVQDVTEDGDELLFQWGTYDWGDGPSFEFDLTRQFILEDEQGDDAIWQLHLTLHFPPDERLGDRTEWWSDPESVETFRDQVLADPLLAQIGQRRPERVEVLLENAG